MCIRRMSVDRNVVERLRCRCQYVSVSVSADMRAHADECPSPINTAGNQPQASKVQSTLLTHFGPKLETHETGAI